MSLVSATENPSLQKLGEYLSFTNFICMQIHLIEHMRYLIIQEKGLLFKPNLRKVEQGFHVSIFHQVCSWINFFTLFFFLLIFGEGSTSHNHQ